MFFTLFYKKNFTPSFEKNGVKKVKDNSSTQDLWANFADFLPNFGNKKNCAIWLTIDEIWRPKSLA